MQSRTAGGERKERARVRQSGGTDSPTSAPFYIKQILLILVFRTHQISLSPMGNASSEFQPPSPNVRERHSKAIYINVPVRRADIAHLILPPCEPDEFDGSCWLSVVVDDLDTLESWVLGRFVPTGLKGWMCKLNLLVKCPILDTAGHSKMVKGYQILTLDFENVWGSRLKVWGARSTQGIPSESAQFDCSFGPSGQSFDAPMADGSDVRVDMVDGKCHLISLIGKIKSNMTDASKLFASFVVDRPHKFLAFERTTLVYSPESGHGSEVPVDGIAMISVENAALLILNRIGIVDEAFDSEKIVAFVQPYYIIVDHKNTSIKHPLSNNEHTAK